MMAFMLFFLSLMNIVCLFIQEMRQMCLEHAEILIPHK